MKTSYENRYAEHPDDVKSYDTKNIRCDFLIEKAFSQDKVSIEYKLLANRTYIEYHLFKLNNFTL